MKEIEKKIKYFNELKELDLKIISLEKLATECNKGAENLKISLSCDKIKESKKEDVLDENGFLKNNNTKPTLDTGFYLTWTDSPITSTSLDATISVSEVVDQKHFFIFLNYMLSKYNERREFLIKKLT